MTGCIVDTSFGVWLCFRIISFSAMACVLFAVVFGFIWGVSFDLMGGFMGCWDCKIYVEWKWVEVEVYFFCV